MTDAKVVNEKEFIELLKEISPEGRKELVAICEMIATADLQKGFKAN